MRLRCESVVCLDNHMWWLHRLYVLVLSVIAYYLWRLRNKGLTLATTNFRGRSWRIHGGCSHGSVDTATIIRKTHASTCTLLHLTPLLLLDEPQIAIITIEAHVTYHIPFEHTSQSDINHVISYYAYFGFKRSSKPL